MRHCDSAVPRERRAGADGIVTAVSRSPGHTLAKANEDSIFLAAGLGVDGDAHPGATVKHRSRVVRDAAAPNLRQVHLIHAELHDALRQAGFPVAPGQMGENITTSGLDLLGLAAGTRLHLGGSAVVEVTGLRNPCAQLDKIQKGLMAATLDRDGEGNLVRKAGIMGIVLASGEVRPGDRIRVEPPPPPIGRSSRCEPTRPRRDRRLPRRRLRRAGGWGKLATRCRKVRGEPTLVESNGDGGNEVRYTAQYVLMAGMSGTRS
jgi:hypothetical protein